MISQGDVLLSVISKNFFFMFFNFFIVFTALGTASMSLEGFGTQPLRETALELALSLQSLRQFYVNFIILQALGLLPLRLLEFGNVSLYPIGMMTAKTPRGMQPTPY
jgi:calcium permeable stress-gated cation channel